MRTLLLLLTGTIAFADDDAAAIMTKVAANVEKSTDARRHYVYKQSLISNLVRSNGKIARKEHREYQVFPTETGSEKKLVSLEGQLRRGKQSTNYTEPGFKDKDLDIDGDLIRDLINDLVDDKNSRDGIPPALFPLRTKDLPRYRFTGNGEVSYEGRRTFRILFEPLVKSHCITIGGDDECDSPSWKGEAWIDAEELQPVRIQTQQAFQVPWGVKVFLGTNIQQSGFAITYQRLAENVWFPVSYGTEFRFNLLWGYRRTLTLSLTSSDFKKASADSKVEYGAVRPQE
jgi:hypothetical protein